jgi:uncharacterized membrane protein
MVEIQESNGILETEQSKIQEAYATTKIEESLKVLELDEDSKIKEPNGIVEVVVCNGRVVNLSRDN